MVLGQQLSHKEKQKEKERKENESTPPTTH